MELQQLAFYSRIRRGMVEKVLNMDSHGRPAFRFKTIKAIYESENAKTLGSYTTLRQQGRRLMDLPLGCGGIKNDSPVLFTGGRKIKSDPELCDLTEDACDIKRNGDMDDFSFSEMTLTQLKERSKTRKRKLPKSVDLKVEEPCSHLNEDYTKLQPKEDESGLEETLSILKLKLSKKPRAKRKCIKKEVHSPSKSAVSVSEQTPSVHQVSSQRTGDLNGSIKTKIETSKLDFSDCHDLDGLTFGAAPNTHSIVDTSANASDEVAGIARAISPPSQEKLCQALDADYLNDEIGLSKCRGRLHFGEQSKIKASSTRSDHEGVEVKVNLQRNILKLKNEKSTPNLLVPKGILKSPNVSCAMPRAAAESTPAQTHAESAIAFSECQMCDIECLAMKLVKELKFIKDIVEDKLHSEVYPSTTLKYTVDERSSGKKASAALISGYGLHKGRKRIIFADEAGGSLCHVKVFEDQLARGDGSVCASEGDFTIRRSVRIKKLSQRAREAL